MVSTTTRRRISDTTAYHFDGLLTDADGRGRPSDLYCVVNPAGRMGVGVLDARKDRAPSSAVAGYNSTSPYRSAATTTVIVSSYAIADRYSEELWLLMHRVDTANGAWRG